MAAKAADVGKTSEPAMLRITWTRSTIGSPERIKQTIRALGFRRLYETIERPDNPTMRGMVGQVGHLVEVEEVEG
jgi:large subunit ribosomal protein L30